MSNVNGNLVCEADGTGTVTANVEGTEVAVHAVASLNGLGAVELGHGNHSYTLSANFPQGTKVFLNVYRQNQDKDNVLIKVLTVDCPQPTATTAAPTTTTAVTGQTTTTVAQRESQPTLPATGGGELAILGLATASILIGSGLMAWARRLRGES